MAATAIIRLRTASDRFRLFEQDGRAAMRMIAVILFSFLAGVVALHVTANGDTALKVSACVLIGGAFWLMAAMMWLAGRRKRALHPEVPSKSDMAAN
jgi:hypothetical protein